MKEEPLKKDLYVDFIDDRRYGKILLLKKLNNECLESIAKILQKDFQDKQYGLIGGMKYVPIRIYRDPLSKAKKLNKDIGNPEDGLQKIETNTNNHQI